jgi:1-deoxy-D-xylulose-5-phosphate reductoisomerase
MRRTISIFGSTGSIGCNTVSLVEAAGGADAYDVAVLTGAGNVDLLADQARRLRARRAVTADPARLEDLRCALLGSGIGAAAGPAALVEAASEPVDWAMLAIVGAAGLAPGLRLAEHAEVLALANKESLVCAGALMLATCAAHGTRLIPVDSEHNAIHQALAGHDTRDVERLILTASGGPFRDWPRDRMASATPAEARAHPNWAMGARISIDSASMFNKALEVIEAHWLFGAAPEAIEVVVHPQSVIHSMVGFRDGAILAHLGPSDMRGAIGYALNWPERRDLPVERLDFARLARLDFHPVDAGRFPAVGLAYEVLRDGGLGGTVFNAAKEAALDGFLARDIGFLDMCALVEHVTRDLNSEAAGCGAGYDLADVMRLDEAARRASRAWISTAAGK